MLKLLSNGGAVINTDDFYIAHKTSGLDELVFNISVHDENYTEILEESIIEYEQPYLVKAIDAGMKTAKVKCQLNLDELKSAMYPEYSNGSATLAETISGVIPSGWLFLDNSYSTIRHTIEGGFTPYDIIMECAKTYDVVFRFDVNRKRITAYNLDKFEPLGTFASRELNLKEINYKGKSSSFYTRLYAYGKNGLSFSDINNGKPYVENHQYSDKVICAYWQDDRYEVKENLLEDAKKKVKLAGIPERSYECNIADLAKTNPEMYSFQDFSLFSVVRLIDDVKELSIDYQVVEYHEYPYYPEKNVVTLSSTAPKIQNTVKDIKNEITNPNSGFWNVMHNAIDSATDWITGVNGGYVIFHKDENDIPYEILIMDTPDIATAKNVWRWNQNGWGHSSNGYNGPYNLAATIDGGIVADFIITGTMLADRIKGGTLELGGKDNGNGVEVVKDDKGNVIVRIDKNGIRSSGDVLSMDPATGLSAILKNGKLILQNEKGEICAIISYFNDGITIQQYGGKIATIILQRSGDISINSAGNVRVSCAGKLYINSKEAKSGRAVYSDNTYIDYDHGLCVGGKTKEGTF